ncbi:sensor histidine kinase [Rhizosphaericola mali]|uniref:histidine kinase n=1 Tax=Rhizosphaericola mali TaxID=2545455 RepID=A0A5P2G2C7_9BACT|nr:HAMP domain-containing sensor histidine kinase [Rhizosphaericola mali]QES89625.1 HAMP domain-containing histidine kinase [Rhizosphaericola mali]
MIKLNKRIRISGNLWLIIAAWLFTLSFIINNYLSYNATPTNAKLLLEKNIAKKEALFNKVLENNQLLENISQKVQTVSSNELFQLPIGLFVYEEDTLGNDRLLYWNRIAAQIEPKDLNLIDGDYSVNYYNGLFELIKKTKFIGNKQYKFFGLIPIYWQYLQENDYLKNHFEDFPNLNKRFKIEKIGMPVLNGKGKTLFHIGLVSESSDQIKPNNISLIFRLIALAIILLVFQKFINNYARKKGAKKGLFLFLTVIIVARGLSFFFNFPFNFRIYALFDQFIYASDFLNASLGDLFINVILLLWITSFIRRFIHQFKYPLSIKNSLVVKHTIAITGIIALTLTTIGFMHIIESLIRDSTISFDVTNFFSLNNFSRIAFVIIAFASVCYHRLLYIFLLPSRQLGYSTIRKIIFCLITGLLFTIIARDNSNMASDFICVLWLSVLLPIINAKWIDLRKNLVSSSNFLFWTMIYSVSITAVIYYETQNIELKDRKSFAENIGLRSDETGETLIKIAINNLNAYFIQNAATTVYNEIENRHTKDQIINENFSGYLNKYSTEVYFFDSTKQGLYNDDSTSFNTLEISIHNQAKPTDVKNLYYNENTPDRFSYIFRKDLFDDSQQRLIGYCFVLVKPYRYANNTLTFQLYNTSKALLGDVTYKYAYAIYKNRKIITSYNSSTFSEYLDKDLTPKIDYLLKDDSKESTLYYNAGDNKVVVIEKKNNRIIEEITLFAYIFCISIVVLIVSYFIIKILEANFNWRYIKSYFQPNIHKQIQGTIIFISIFSFFVIGISTISFFYLQFNNSNKERLSQSSHVISGEIEYSLKFEEYDKSIVSTNYITDNIGRRILQIAALNNLDINYYAQDGRLISTSQPSIYNKEIYAPWMNPNAYYNIHVKKLLEFTQTETIGSFNFLSIYVPIHNFNGENIGYINVPYLNSQNEVEKQISSFLVTVINLNALIFILAGVIAMQFTRRISDTFTLIGEKMRAINLGKKNELIHYKRKDEIGELVTEYNIMVEKLFKSAEILAKSERQGAWQEMARQVAHEIKNPLTPMKLSIQYLERAINSDAENVKELSKRVTQTLIEQIDQLAKIASDFSQFANINNNNPEVISINDLLTSITSLYVAEPNVTITTQKIEPPIMLWADKTQINRLLTNLIKNAIEATETNKQAQINITQSIHNNKVTIAVHDFGMGIPEDKKKKIFVPNFTTKSSGTGLGLAICKGICESAEGTISFKSKIGEGTTFFITLPIYTPSN